MDAVKLLQLYAEKNATWLHALGKYNPLGTIGTRLGIATIDVADKCFFTPSAMAMHHAVFVPDMLLPSVDNNLWVHIHQTIEYIYNVQAVFLYNRAANKEIDIVVPHKVLDQNARMHEQFDKFKPFWFLNLVDETGTVVCKYSFSTDVKEWAFFFDHICPFGKCKIDDSIRDNLKIAKYTSYVSCEQCKQGMEYWTRWINTALHMVRLDYAITPEPENFSSIELTHTEKALVPRHHGKGKPKEKDVTYHASFKMINYDVSIKSTFSESATNETDKKRGNWLSMHGRDDRIYKRIYPSRINRHYKGNHFDRLIKKCLTGIAIEIGKQYKVTLNDKQYTVTINQSGDVTVVGYVTYPNGKYVAMLKPDLKQQKVIKRITANRFNAE